MTTTNRHPDTFTDLDDPIWLELFENVHRSWFRLETLQVYAVDYEQAEFDRFERTGQFDRPSGDWQHMIRRHALAGRHLLRIHVVKEPLTDYLRYEFAAYQQNNQAGEDVRLVPIQGHDWPSGLPQSDDFWLFDDQEVWDMHYDDQGHFLCATRNTSPDRLAQCRSWRDHAVAQAVTLADYLRARTAA